MTTREGKSFSILLIKNELDDFHFLKQSLEENSRFPSQIDLAANLEEAFLRLRNSDYQMVLMESEFEEENPGSLEKIKAAGLSVPFVLLLPIKDEKMVREAMRCGIADVIVKNENHFKELAEKLRQTYQEKTGKDFSAGPGDLKRFREKIQEKMQAELQIRDQLTGLYTHGYLYERVVREFSRASRYHYPIASIMLDIDSFKTINDEHGYYTGEKLLKEAADLLFENCRMSDFVARYSGEEFCVILPHGNYQDAQELATRLKGVFESHSFLDETHKIKITVSLGVSAYPEDDMKQRGDLIQFANEALLHAKSLGRSRITMFRDVVPEVNEDLPTLNISEDQIVEFQRRLQDTNAMFRKSYLETSRMLIKALETKDKFTVGHSASTAKYSYWVAQAMGMSREEADVVRQGALLHDVGKMCIPDSILLKPGRLTMTEFETMKQHSFLGYKIVKPIKFLQEESLVVLHHHEWFNGQGYPCKLKGHEIPLGARIVSVVDSYDTIRMAGGRYKKTSTVEDTVNELISCSGTQFDPAVVKAFIDVLIARNELQPNTFNQAKLEEALKAAA